MKTTLTKDELRKIHKGECPDCGGNLRQYAQGGLATNVQCQGCHQCFYDGWVFGGERIPNPFYSEETK